MPQDKVVELREGLIGGKMWALLTDVWVNFGLGGWVGDRRG